MTAGVNRRTSLALVVCCCAAASSIHGQGQTTVPGARISIPARHAAAAMLKAVSGHVIVIGRGGGPMPDINDHTIAVLNRNGEEIFARAPGRDIAYARTVVLEDATITADGNLDYVLLWRLSVSGELHRTGWGNRHGC